MARFDQSTIAMTSGFDPKLPSAPAAPVMAADLRTSATRAGD
ncbi:hypothetical protein [Sneathiella marina]|nr:hypothetical protein [Sneathiella marina]